MNKYIRIGGMLYWIPDELDVGRTQVFDGIGSIKASAIKRTSKNRYIVYVIFDWHAEHYVHKGIGTAIDNLQDLYNKYGVIPECVGKMEQENAGETT